jgi:hypothetical protein
MPLVKLKNGNTRHYSQKDADLLVLLKKGEIIEGEQDEKPQDEKPAKPKKYANKALKAD